MKALEIIVFFLVCLQLKAQVIETGKENNTVYTIVEVPPSFPGGLDSLKSYVKYSTIYPEVYRRYRCVEWLFVKFVVKKDGSISNVKLIQGGFREFERVALSVIENMPKCNPGLQNGEPLRCYVTFAVKFCPESCAG
jgi:protein TonB